MQTSFSRSSTIVLQSSHHPQPKRQVCVQNQEPPREVSAAQVRTWHSERHLLGLLVERPLPAALCMLGWPWEPLETHTQELPRPKRESKELAVRKLRFVSHAERPGWDGTPGPVGLEDSLGSAVALARRNGRCCSVPALAN